MLILRLLLGLVAGGTLSLIFALGARLVPADRAGVALGALSASGGLGGAAAPLLAGAIGSLSLHAVFLVNAGLYVAALALALTVLASAQRSLRAEARR